MDHSMEDAVGRQNQQRAEAWGDYCKAADKLTTARDALKDATESLLECGERDRARERFQEAAKALAEYAELKKAKKELRAAARKLAERDDVATAKELAKQALAFFKLCMAERTLPLPFGESEGA